MPKIDDGAKDISTSLQMLRMEQEQAVDCVIATPHFYLRHESLQQFLERRNAAFAALQKDAPVGSPRVILGAEVAFTKSLLYEDLSKLCIAGTNTLLLELPYEKMDLSLMRAIQALIQKNTVTIVLAHIERFRPIWKKSEFEEIMSLPVKKQINAGSLLHGNPFQRHWLLKMIADEEVHFIGTDAHNCESRPVNFKAAMDYLDKKGLSEQRKEMMHQAQKLLFHA